MAKQNLTYRQYDQHQKMFPPCIDKYIADYDTYGNIKTTATGNHPAITYNYDSVNKYDIRGIRSGLTDQVGSTTSFTFNKRGQLTGKTDPLNKVSSATYDNAGRLISKTDRKGATINYAYTASSKLASVTYPDSTMVTYTYNNLDQLVSMQDSLGTTTYNSYDAAGRLTSMTDPNGFVISYTYDDLGNVKTLTYPGNKTVVYTYDNLNRLKTVTNWLNQTATYANYDAAGRLPGFTNFNGTTTSYGYDNANRLTAINNLKADNSVISSYTFTLDANGNRTNNVQSEPYAPAMDTVNAAYTYNTQKNRLLSTSADSFTYDDEGQLATSSSGSYTFDYEHRLKTIPGTNVAQFFYDGGGKRLKAIRSGVETRYIYDARGVLLAEADSSNNITKYYIYGNGLLATVTPAGQTYCYHFNGVGSTVALTDNTQAVVNQYSYDAFGNIANQLENMLNNDTKLLSQPFKYVGQFGVMTEPNGFYYMRARYYDPKVGRFISEDPKGFDGGDMNLMAYVGNNPVLFVDPSGLDKLFFNGYQLLWLSDMGQKISSYSAISGPYGLGSLPNGTYTGDNLRLRTAQGMVCPSGGWSLDLTPQFETNRTLLRIHPDEPPIGTLGCIGINCADSGRAYQNLSNYLISNSTIDLDVYIGSTYSYVYGYSFMDALSLSYFEVSEP